ncbi:hypothetical protein WJX74_006871 [Apatococcus lobatus]|uniref:C2H2-type domain-containing protein n=1 Tax=Apatococcus lobatus TaxID=904363 RepID=A0AAW1R0A9_9CHLO
MASGAPHTRTAPEVPAATGAASVASDTRGQHGDGPVADGVILGRFAQASRCRNGRRDLGHEDAGSETSRAQIREARGLTTKGQMMLVAEPAGGEGPTRIKFCCPDPGCKATLMAPFRGSASNIMRHFRYHQDHAGEGVRRVLFAACQVQYPSGQRFTYVSDEYGEVGRELLVRGGLDALALHPRISAQPQPQPHQASGSGSGSDQPAAAAAATGTRRTRKRSGPGQSRPEGRAARSRERPRQPADTEDDRWAEQGRLNAEQARTIAEQQARINKQDKVIAKGQDFMDEQEARNEDFLGGLLGLRQFAMQCKRETEAGLAELDARLQRLQKHNRNMLVYFSEDRAERAVSILRERLGEDADRFNPNVLGKVAEGEPFASEVCVEGRGGFDEVLL